VRVPAWCDCSTNGQPKDKVILIFHFFTLLQQLKLAKDFYVTLCLNLSPLSPLSRQQCAQQ
jgi:hypothetical protein